MLICIQHRSIYLDILNRSLWSLASANTRFDKAVRIHIAVEYIPHTL